ncbi:MAG: hypothetical protein WCG40_10645 [Actinomycetes bacterium]
MSDTRLSQLFTKSIVGSLAGRFVRGCLNQQWRAPFGLGTQLRVFADPDLLQYEEAWAGAGASNDNFGAAPADIVRVAGGVATDLKRV